MSALSQNTVRVLRNPPLAEEDERSAYLEEVRYYSTQFGSGHRDDEPGVTDAADFSARPE